VMSHKQVKKWTNAAKKKKRNSSLVTVKELFFRF
jgi:hypothetical protein